MSTGVSPRTQQRCNSEPTILYSDAIYSHLYVAEYALTYTECEVHGGSTYQLFRDGQSNQNFVIDLGCELFIKEFVLRNTRNGVATDRGTNEFTLEASLDNSNWNVAVSGSLEKVWHYDVCELPFFTFPAFVQARYVRFTAHSYYNKGAGLNYITWNLAD